MFQAKKCHGTRYGCVTQGLHGKHILRGAPIMLAPTIVPSTPTLTSQLPGAEVTAIKAGQGPGGKGEPRPPTIKGCLKHT